MSTSSNGARKAGERLVLRRWSVHNWMNFREASFPVGDRLFVVGPNASGKSNLLDSLRFLRDLVSVGGGLQEAVRKRQGVSAIRCLAARARPSVRLAIELATQDAADPTWSYELAFKQDNQSNPIVESEVVRKRGRVVLARPEKEDDEDPQRLRQTALEQVNANREFRSIADFLKSVEYLHLVPQIIRDPERAIGKKEDPFGGDFLQRIAGVTERTRNARLRRIREALKIAVPQLSELVLKTDERGVPHLRGRYEHWRPQGGWQDESQFSDGTLRLIGLLWAVLSATGPILLEEPELSLHGEIVRHLPGVLEKMARSGRQVFLSTHSRELLSDESIGLDEVLLLFPIGKEGTQAKLAGDDQEVRDLLEGGIPMSDVVIPRTAPRSAGQLSLFDLE